MLEMNDKFDYLVAMLIKSNSLAVEKVKAYDPRDERAKPNELGES